MIVRSIGTRPPPLDLIDTAIKGKWKNSTFYSELLEELKLWYASMGVRREPLQFEIGATVNVTFVDYQLTLEQVAAATAWWDDMGLEGTLLLNDVIKDGYRVSYVWDSKNQCVVVSLIGKSPDNPNRNLCMVTRHGTVARSVALALYKHLVVFEGKAWGEQSPEQLFG